MTDVVVVTGAGGMGEAVVRRIGSGCSIVLADVGAAPLARVADALTNDGYAVHPVRTDITVPAEVTGLARIAADLGPIRCVVHTAGVSPVQATSRQIVDVDVIGTARVLDAFEAHVRPGTVAVCIASMAGTMTQLDAETLQLLATTPTDELHTLAVLDPSHDGARHRLRRREAREPRARRGGLDRVGSPRRTGRVDQPGRHRDTHGPSRSWPVRTATACGA